jgi:hypothetical protein
VKAKDPELYFVFVHRRQLAGFDTLTNDSAESTPSG